MHRRSFLDESIGNILDCLDKMGLAHAVVVYTSIKAFPGEHGWFDKRFIYEESFQCRS